MAVTAYPNPASDLLNIDVKNVDLKNYNDASIKLYNDKMVAVKSISYNELLNHKTSERVYSPKLSCNDLKRGLYFLSLEAGNTILQTTKILLQ